MDNSDNPITDYWLRHYLDEQTGFCSLCGQSGIINTVEALSPAGIKVGRYNYCICPNGQYLRKKFDEEKRK